MSYDELLEAHERDVTRVLDLLVRHKLTGSSDKATIAVSEVVSAGHVVGNGHIGVYQDVCRVCGPNDGHTQGQPRGDQEGVQEGSGPE